MTTAVKPTKDAAAASTSKPPRTKRAKVDRKDEAPRDRFRRVAKPRLEAALKRLRQLETVGRSAGYEFSTDQANAVMKYIDEAVEKVRMAFVARVNAKPEDSVTL